MKPLPELAQRVAETQEAITARLAALPEPGMEPRPAVRAQLAEARRVLVDSLASVGGDWSAVGRGRGRERVLQRDRALVVATIGEWDGLSETAPTRAERDAYALGADWLRGGASAELPGAVIMKRKELPRGGRLVPLPILDDELAKLEADLGQAVARLVATLDEWDRSHAQGSVASTLPVPEVRIDASVK